MEMHQIRYFLAVARQLNFTRAAEECGVSQPSLTRGVKLLEHELGGDLLRRERGLTHLTPLGERMLPILEQCFESAKNARAIALAMKARKTAALRLGVARSIDIAPFLRHIVELLGVFEGLALRIVRDDADAVEQALREGATDLAIYSAGERAWDRIERWPLFAEPMMVAFHPARRFANRASIPLGDLRGERVVLRTWCETSGPVRAALEASGVDLSFALEAGDERDLLGLLAADIGVALLPASLRLPPDLRAAPVEGVALRREICVHAVQGRERGPAAAMLLTQFRAADWGELQRPAAITA